MNPNWFKLSISYVNDIQLNMNLEKITGSLQSIMSYLGSTSLYHFFISGVFEGNWTVDQDEAVVQNNNKCVRNENYNACKRFYSVNNQNEEKTRVYN